MATIGATGVSLILLVVLLLLGAERLPELSTPRPTPPRGTTTSGSPQPTPGAGRAGPDA